ncbi:hypothetical protein WG907_06860 [Sphingobium sp. AN558]|uniref:hypothetical protein n=1 Tax=Sphingobium sp. AN558 TaxID=3133442 RepID=UPI0030C59621
MTGLLSSAPGTASIRLLMGSQLLLVVQAGLVVRAQGAVSDTLWAISLAALLMGLACLASAVRGERPDASIPVGRPTHGR